MVGNQYVVFHGVPEVGMPMISAMKAVRMTSKACEAYLACVVNSSGKHTSIQDVPVVKDYSDVFVDELLGLPPHKAVDFEIWLVPRTEPISKASYRIALTKMVELKV